MVSNKANKVRMAGSPFRKAPADCLLGMWDKEAAETESVTNANWELVDI